MSKIDLNRKKILTNLPLATSNIKNVKSTTAITTSNIRKPEINLKSTTHQAPAALVTNIVNIATQQQKDLKKSKLKLPTNFTTKRSTVVSAQSSSNANTNSIAEHVDVSSQIDHTQNAATTSGTTSKQPAISSIPSLFRNKTSISNNNQPHTNKTQNVSTLNRKAALSKKENINHHQQQKASLIAPPKVAVNKKKDLDEDVSTKEITESNVNNIDSNNNNNDDLFLVNQDFLENELLPEGAEFIENSINSLNNQTLQKAIEESKHANIKNIETVLLNESLQINAKSVNEEATNECKNSLDENKRNDSDDDAIRNVLNELLDKIEFNITNESPADLELEDQCSSKCSIPETDNSKITIVPETIVSTTNNNTSISSLEANNAASINLDYLVFYNSTSNLSQLSTTTSTCSLNYDIDDDDADNDNNNKSSSSSSFGLINRNLIKNMTKTVSEKNLFKQYIATTTCKPKSNDNKQLNQSQPNKSLSIASTPLKNTKSATITVSKNNSRNKVFSASAALSTSLLTLNKSGNIVLKQLNQQKELSSNTSIMSAVSNISKISLPMDITIQKVRVSKKNDKKKLSIDENIHLQAKKKSAISTPKAPTSEKQNKMTNLKSAEKDVNQQKSNSLSTNKKSSVKKSSELLSNQKQNLEKIEQLSTSNELKSKQIIQLENKFHGTLIAYNYLSNTLNGFQTPILENKLRKLKNQNYEQQCLLEEKQNELNRLDDRLKELENDIELKNESFQKKSDEQNDLIMKLKSDNDKLNEQLKQTKLDNLKLKEQNDEKANEIEKFTNFNSNSINEINSLKIALEIKNRDLSELRFKYNDLYNKNEYYSDLDLKLRKYEHDVENLREIVKNKHMTEQQISEQNRLLAMKVEKKHRENQRLSMQNEELQFRLQSQPNLTECFPDNEDESKIDDETMIIDENNQMKIDNTLVTMRRRSNTNCSSKSKSTASSKISLYRKQYSSQSPSRATNSKIRPCSVDLSSETKTAASVAKTQFNNFDYQKQEVEREIEFHTKQLDRESYLYLSMFYEHDNELPPIPPLPKVTTNQNEFNSESDSLMSKSVPCMNFNETHTEIANNYDNCEDDCVIINSLDL